jgi:hypothetical protein
MRMNGGATQRGPALAIGIEVFITIGAALFLGMLIVRSATAAVALGAGMALFLSLARAPLAALSLLVFCIPFSQTTFFNESVAEFPGARPFLLLGAFVAFIAFINWRNFVQIPRIIVVFGGIAFTLLVIAVLRSLPNVGMIAAAVEQEYTPLGFILSHVVKPSLYLMPMIIVAKFATTGKDVNRLAGTLVFSLIALSVYFLYDYTFNVQNKGDIEAAWEVVGESLGLWKGMAGFLYVVGFPMVLARYFVKKDVFSIVGIVLCVISVGFLYSRTAYVTVVAAFFLYLFFSKRTRFLPVLIVLGLGASLIISETIIERATKGFESSDLNQVASGRVEHQWIPLAEEYSKTPVDIALGRGRFALLTTRVWQSGILPGAAHPHNMFIEMILDGGLVSLFILLAFITAIMWKAYQWIPMVKTKEAREYLCGSLVAMICYLMGGMTTGSMFPTLENSYFWLIAGLAMVIIKQTRVSGASPSTRDGSA